LKADESQEIIKAKSIIFDLSDGENFGLIGPEEILERKLNRSLGAGKSFFLGHWQHESGKVRFLEGMDW